jgi:hypothetical protein
MSNIQNPIDTPLKDGGKPKKLPIKQVAFGILTDNGVSVADAEKALSYADRTGYAIANKLKKYKLKESKLISPAYKALQETLKMKPLQTNEYKTCPSCKGKENERPEAAICLICKGRGVLRVEIYPNHATRIEAAKMVYERFDPAIKHQANINVNMDVDPVEMARYLNR